MRFMVELDMWFIVLFVFYLKEEIKIIFVYDLIFDY